MDHSDRVAAIIATTRLIPRAGLERELLIKESVVIRGNRVWPWFPVTGTGRW